MKRLKFNSVLRLVDDAALQLLLRLNESEREEEGEEETDLNIVSLVIGEKFANRNWWHL